MNVTEAGLAFLKAIEQQMGIVADLSRADILLYGRLSEKEAIVLAHAPPHSLAHVYAKSREGRIIDVGERPGILKALVHGRRLKEARGFIAEGAPVVRQVLPVCFPPPVEYGLKEGQQTAPRSIAVLVIVTNLIEHERHRLRSRVFRNALKKLQLMLSYGRILGAENLSSFGEQDGIIFTDSRGVIQYASGIAANFYRRLGYRETLVGRHLAELETEDEELRRLALEKLRCLEREDVQADRFWIRKALPMVSYQRSYRQWLIQPFRVAPLRESLFGVIITLHDDTEIRRQDQEIRVKNAMIQEVHHRVKNNLQTIAGLVRMQARRTRSEEARQVLDEALTRILSVAVIHEFLSNENSNIINIKEVSGRIIAQFQQGMLSPDQAIKLELFGDSIYLPARQATACSLIINELLQNALEHGFEHKQEGFIRINLEDNGNEVIIRVTDNGDGLPVDFNLEEAHSLGFQIVRTLVEGDLKGQIELSNGDGLAVTIKFPKKLFKGEEGWKEHVSL